MASLQHTLPDPKERIDDPAGSWASKTLSALDDEVPVKTTTTTTTTTKEPLSSSSTGISSTQSSIPSTTNKSTTSPLTAHQPTHPPTRLHPQPSWARTTPSAPVLPPRQVQSLVKIRPSSMALRDVMKRRRRALLSLARILEFMFPLLALSLQIWGRSGRVHRVFLLAQGRL
ncbi:hypothetical protein BDQ17DRAFT_725710 [Cyathus striatus]|nr:hypothetical protein BDQ17DRAFT_725710 [Cyathus striatus]